MPVPIQYHYNYNAIHYTANEKTLMLDYEALRRYIGYKFLANSGFDFDDSLCVAVCRLCVYVSGSFCFQKPLVLLKSNIEIESFIQCLVYNVLSFT